MPALCGSHPCGPSPHPAFARGYRIAARLLRTSQLFSFQQAAHSLSPLFARRPFFSSTCALFRKIPGGGVALLIRAQVSSACFPGSAGRLFALSCPSLCSVSHPPSLSFQPLTASFGKTGGCLPVAPNPFALLTSHAPIPLAVFHELRVTSHEPLGHCALLGIALLGTNPGRVLLLPTFRPQILASL